MRAASAVLVLVALAACDPARVGGGAARVDVAVAGRNIVVAAPPGFCVDAASTNVSASGAFVMVTDCALLGARGVIEEGDATPAGAVMTASVSAGQLPSTGAIGELERLVSTPEGRAALGRSGRADRVRVRAVRTRNDVLYVLVEDRGPPPIAGIEPTFWRAFLEVSGQMTVLSVLGFEGAGVGPTEGLALIQRFADHMQAANRA